jgi:hypothetical protein
MCSLTVSRNLALVRTGTFFACILDQICKEFNEIFGVKGIVNNHPVGLALVGHHSEQRVLLRGATYSQCYEFFS